LIFDTRATSTTSCDPTGCIGKDKAESSALRPGAGLGESVFVFLAVALSLLTLPGDLSE
jgi:hypothetical protein